MNKLLVGIGLLFIISGIILASTSEIVVNEPRAHVVNTSKKEWSVSGNLTAGDKIVIGFYPNFRWASITDVNDEYPYGFVEVVLDITDPYGNVTRFLWPWAKPASGVGLLLQDPTNIRVVSNGSLINPGFVEIGAFGGCGGIVRYSGLYNVSVFAVLGTKSGIPPAAIQIVKEIQVETKPYTGLLPAGISTSVLGSFCSIYGMKTKKTKKTKRMFLIKNRKK